MEECENVFLLPSKNANVVLKNNKEKVVENYVNSLVSFADPAAAPPAAPAASAAAAPKKKKAKTKKKKPKKTATKKKRKRAAPAAPAEAPAADDHPYMITHI